MMLHTLVLATLTVAPKVAIVDIWAPEGMMGLGALVTRALVAEAQAQKLNVMSPEQLRGSLDAPRYEALKKCGGNVACAAQHLEPLGAKRAVLGQLGRDEKNYLLKLWLVDIPALTVLASVDRPILIAARRLQKDVEQAVPALLRGEQEARGTLVIESSLADLQVTLNGDSVGSPPLKMSLKPGKYEVKAERRKYLPVARWVSVEANQETKLTLSLFLKPGEIADEKVVPALTKQVGASSSPGVQLSALTWILGGATVAAAGAGVGFGLLARSQRSTLEASYDAQARLYQGTRALALEHNRNALIANVALGVAGGALTGTIISAIVDATRPPTVEVALALSPTPGVILRGSF